MKNNLQNKMSKLFDVKRWLTALIFVLTLCLNVKTYAVVPPVIITQNASTVGRYDIYELTMTNPTSYSNPYDGLDIVAIFTSPSFKTYSVGGFYYAENTWKLRFAPVEAGTWSWSLTYNDGQGIYDTTGTFTATASNNTGFLRIHPNNPCRFMTEANGKAFYPLGYDDPYETTADFFINTTAAGNNIQRAYGGSTNSFLGTFNKNNSGMNLYNLDFGLQGDQFAEWLHKYGMKYQMSFFVSPPTMDLTSNPVVRQAMLNYHKYMINRLGAYVDIWELFNEQSGVPQSYLDTITTFIHNKDPYRHLITLSYDQPQDNQSAIDFVGTHQYMSSDDKDLDNQISISNLRAKYNIPVLLGEGGNASPQGAYSPLRYRIQIWTAFFCEGGILFWKGGAKSACQVSQNGGGAGISNQYIGSEEYVESKILSDFTSDFDPAATPINPTLTPANQMRCYALSSSVDQGIYIVHSSNHNSILSGGTVRTTIPCAMQGQWIDPATGILLQTISVNAGLQTISIPPFRVDIVLRLLAVPAQSVLQFNTPGYTIKGDQSSVTLSVNRLGGNNSNAVSVDYISKDILAKSGIDYSAVSGTLNWAVNDSSPKTITVPLIISPTLKPDLTFNVVLSNPTGGAVLGFSNNAMVTKFNTVINAGAYNSNCFVVKKNDSVLNVQVNRIGSGVGPMSVYYATRGPGGTDFVAIPDGKNTLNWNDADMAPKSFQVKILNTAAVGKQFFVTMDDNGWSVPGSTYANFVRASVTILDPASSPGVLTFSGSPGMTMNGYGYASCAYNVYGNAGSIALPVSRIGGKSGAVSVTYTSMSQSLHVGTALHGIDYTDVNGTLNWADGDTSNKFITVPITNNTSWEIGNTTFYVYLGNAGGGALTSTPTTAEVTIINSTISNSITISSCPTQFCKGEIFSIQYQATGTYSAGNVFAAQLSDNNGRFLSPVLIGECIATSSGTINATIPQNANAGSPYRIRVVSSNPSITGSDNGFDITINALPVLQIQGIQNAYKNSTEHYSVQDNPGSHYKWSVEGGSIIGADTSNAVDILWGETDSGIIKIIETTNVGCTDSVSLHIILLVNSVRDLKNTGISINLIPNPMSGIADIEITSDRAMRADIQIVNSIGIVIKDFNNVILIGGTQKLSWNGNDSSGKDVPAGVYFIKLNDKIFKLMKI